MQAGRVEEPLEIPWKGSGRVRDLPGPGPHTTLTAPSDLSGGRPGIAISSPSSFVLTFALLPKLPGFLKMFSKTPLRFLIGSPEYDFLIINVSFGIAFT